MSFFKPRAGMNLIEVLVAAAIAGIVLLALGGFISRNFIANNGERDRTFAMQKAIQMLEEISAYKLQHANDSGPDTFAEQGIRFELTTVEGVAPDGPLSGNTKAAGKYRFVRQVLSETVPGDEFARQVTVKVWYADTSSAQPAASGVKPLAVVSGVMRSNVGSVGPKNVFDLYVISIENLPHVYHKQDDHPYRQFKPSTTAARRSFMSALSRFQDTNPWASFRVHYISRMSVGRDAKYRPYMNEASPLTGSGRDVLDHVYFYPGLVEAGGDRYYDYQDIKGNVRVNTSGSILEDLGSYPLADQFNHAVRYPQEFDASNRPINAVTGAVATEPSQLSLRQFLEDLLTDTTGNYRNAILVNLHGELFPALPLRNYADPAKDFYDPDISDTDVTDKESMAMKRAIVTHPYKLNFGGLEKVRLMVHPFLLKGDEITPRDLVPASGAPGNTFNQDVYVDSTFPTYAKKARITIKGVAPFLKDPLGGAGDINDVAIKVIQRSRTNSGNDNAEYVTTAIWPSGACPTSNHSGPHVRSGHAGGTDPVVNGDDVVIELDTLDYDARKVLDGTTVYGIDYTSPDYLLHRLQYFPDPFLPLLSHPSGGVSPRNTARAVIELELTSAASGQRFEVLTQLYKYSSTTVGGVLPATDDAASSRTWFYFDAEWDPTAKLYRQVLAPHEPTIPWTDQVQLVGDPRHNPYYDFRKEGLFNPYFTEWGDSKELYKGITNQSGDSSKFIQALATDFPSATDLPPPAPSAVGWDLKFEGSAHSYEGMKYNVPAYFRMWREALLRNQMLFVNMSGEPFRHLGLGGEFCLNGYIDDSSELNISSRPWNSSGGDANSQANELFGLKDNDGDRHQVNLIERRDDQWASRPWLGLSYPFERGAAWNGTGSDSGNLPSSDSSSSNFRRQTLNDISTDYWDKWANKSDDHNRKRINNQVAFASFLNAHLSGGTTPVMVARDGGSDGTQTSTGETMANALRASLDSSLKATYSFKLDSGNLPPEWNTNPYLDHAGVEWLLPTAVTPPGYYRHDKGSDYFANAPLLLMDSPSSPTKKAVVLANTFRGENSSAIPKLFDVGVSSMLEAFLDGTRHAIGEYNVKPLPRVKLKTPRTGESLTGTTVPLQWYAKWVKANGKDFSAFFSEFSETYTPPPATTSGGPLDIVYIVKYRGPDNVWKTAELTTPTSASLAFDGTKPIAEGVPVRDTSVALVPHVTYPGAITATWVIGPAATGVPNGDYLLRIEAFRTTDDSDHAQTLEGHYSYHEIPVNINR